MAKKFYTVLVLPDATGKTKKFHITKTAITVVASVGAVAFILFGFFIQQFVGLKVHLLELARLRREVKTHEATLSRMQALEQELAQVRDLDGRLRMVAGLKAPAGAGGAKPAAMGGVQSNVSQALEEAIRTNKLSVMDRMSSELDQLSSEMTQRLASLRELWGHLEERRSALASTPTIWPVRGLVTSTFGYRRSPFTGGNEFHDGLDVSAPHGTPIMVAADGTVIYAGPLSGGYGNVVYIDHGHGFNSFYGHNSRNLVTTGQRVKRGQIIGQVGNTGMSTGPHVHYSIRYKGVWMNPLKFIVDVRPDSPELASVPTGPEAIPEDNSRVKSIDQALKKTGGTAPVRSRRARRG